MRARFIGDPRHDGRGPDTITVFGLTFRKNGEWVDISASPVAMKKLPGHSHFEVSQGIVAKPKAVPAPAPVKAAAPAPKPVEASPPPSPAPAVEEIPADWADAHHTKRIAWAKRLSGGEVKTVAIADAIIAAHLTPKEAPKPAEPPVEEPDDDGFSDLE